MTFELESDLRRWVRKCETLTFRWVEPSRGSTIGLPDCFTHLRNGRLTPTTVWMELKVGELHRDEGMIRFTTRPEQKRVIEGMTNEGGIVVLLVGQKGGDRVWMMAPELALCTGWIDLEHTTMKGMSWVAGPEPWMLDPALRVAVEAQLVPLLGPAFENSGVK